MDDNRYTFFIASLIRLTRSSFRSWLYPAVPVAVLAVGLSDTQGKLFFMMLSVGALLSKFYLVLAKEIKSYKLAILVGLGAYGVGAVIAALGFEPLFLFSAILIGIGMGELMPLSNVLSKSTATTSTQAVRKQSLMGFFNQLMGAIALVSAGYCTEYLGWQSNFIILVVIGLVVFIFVCFLGKVKHSAVEGKHALSFAVVKRLLRDQFYLSLVFIFSALVVSLMVALVMTSFFYIHTLGMAPHMCALLLLPCYATGMLGRSLCYKLNDMLSFTFYCWLAHVPMIIGLVFFYIAYFFPHMVAALSSMAIVMIALSYGMLSPYIQSTIANDYEKVITQASSLLSFVGSILLIIMLTIAAALSTKSTLPLRAPALKFDQL